MASADFLRLMLRLQEIWDVVSPISDTFQSAFDATLRAIKGDVIHSENDDINKMWALGKTWNKQLGTLAKKDENYWIEVSGANVLDSRQSTRSLEQLLVKREHYNALRQGCEGLKLLAVTVSVSDHVDIRGIGSSLTSLKALDIEARRQTLREFDRCIGNVDQLLPPLSRAIEALQDSKNALHRFLVLQHSQDRVADMSRFRDSSTAATSSK